MKTGVHEPGCPAPSDGPCRCRADRLCWRCGERVTYDGWDHVHENGIGIGSCSPRRRTRSHDGAIRNVRGDLWLNADGLAAVMADALLGAAAWLLTKRVRWMSGNDSEEHRP